VGLVLPSMTDTQHIQEPPLLERIGKALQERLDDIVQEPLPERWTDLIHRLNAEELARMEDRH
jgi:hypothetical protein